MTALLLVIGSVTSMQYAPVRFMLMKEGLKPKILRVNTDQFSAKEFRAAQSAAGEDQLEDLDSRSRYDLVEVSRGDMSQDDLLDEGDDPYDTVDGPFLDIEDWFREVFFEQTGHPLSEVRAVVFDRKALDACRSEASAEGLRDFSDILAGSAGSAIRHWYICEDGYLEKG